MVPPSESDPRDLRDLRDLRDPADPTATAARAVPAPLGLRIRVVEGQATPREFILHLGTCVIGAGHNVDLEIVDPLVSRRHASLRLVPEGAELVDLGSRNGTFCMGQRVEKMIVAPGGRLRVGSTELVLEPLLDELAEGGDRYRGMIGRSPAMRRLFAMLTRLEGSLVSVLIGGESGVGKELVARAIHEGSARCQRPLVVVNCAAIARELVLSELFGHKKGAFTGASDHRVGAFEEADGGTLFLDEIGELPLDLQPALLRALEQGEIRRVGENQARSVNVRVLAATNRDLLEEVRAGRFREDLYYRLAVVSLRVPPLSERPEDTEALALELARREGVLELPRDFLDELKARPLPGNVRELRNVVLAYLALGEVAALPAPDTAQLEALLRREVDLQLPYANQKDLLVARFTRVYLELLLASTGGNLSEAARVANLDRGYLRTLVAKHLQRAP
ncbi:MAG: sigma 54-interacting transcriptional regulator [Kofleriaceae bacterium]